MIKKSILTAALALLMAGSVSAQTVRYEKGELKSYTFIELQGGVQATLSDPGLDKLIQPAAGINFGHFFTPEAGLRIGAYGWKGKAGFKALDQYYKYNFISTNIDLLVNLTNLFSEKKAHPLNLFVVGGFGLNYAWDNDDLDALQAQYPTQTATPLRWNDNRLMHNIRAGLRLETNVDKPVGISLEVLANNTNDRFNSKTNDACDWNISAMLGVNFRLGRKYTQKKIVEEPAPQPVPEPVVVKEPEPEPEPEPVVVEPKTIRENIFYKINAVNPSTTEMPKVENVANFLKDNPDAKVTVVSYADAGTGNAKINAKLAQQRADNVKNVLVKKYGIDGSRISTESHGDTVQPFPENDKNRVSIVEGTTAK